MSHVVHVQTEIRDVQALQAACQRLHLQPPVLETVELFSGQATGYAVRLPAWKYAAVCHVETGTVEFDNYGGRWGQQCELDNLLQGLFRGKNSHRSPKTWTHRHGAVTGRRLGQTHASGGRCCPMKTIQLIIAPNGQVRLETKGYSGSACVEASRFLEAALGKQLSETKTGRLPRSH